MKTARQSGLATFVATVLTLALVLGIPAFSTMASAMSTLFAPDAPTDVTTKSLNGAANVMWAAPASDGGSAISNYGVQYSIDAGTNWSDAEQCIGVATSCTVYGLTNGTRYSFRVAAMNAVGWGAYSDEWSSVTPRSAPDAPTNVSATAANGSAMVSFTAPANNGGSAITRYTVTASPGGATCTATAPATTCTVSGLTNGTAYTFTVTATNGVGTSSASTASSSVTPVSAPNAPTSVTATTGNGSTTLTWNGPDVDGGSVITGYYVQYSSDGGETWQVAMCSGLSTSCVIDNVELSTGYPYSFRVAAINAVGTGPYSSVSNAVTPYGTPAAPTITSVVPSSTGTDAVVTFTHPTDTGGDSVTGYTASAYDVMGTMIGSCTTTGTSCTITGLTKGYIYFFKVRTYTTHGSSAQSAPVSLTIPLTTQKVNAYIRGWSYAQREISDGMRKAIGAVARLIVAGNNKTVTVTGFANFTAKKSLSTDRAVNVAAYLRRELNRFGGRSITIKVVTGGSTTKFGGTVLNRVAVIQGR